MSIISKCPKCQRAITVPDGIVSDATVRCPICEEEYPLSDALAEAPPSLVPVGGSGDSDVLGAEMPGAIAAMGGAGSAGLGEEPIDFDLGGEASGSQEKETAAAAMAAPKKKKKKSTFRMMAEPIIGGFLGLGVMYYGLNYFTGDERHDFLEVYLPGCPHTYHHWPGGGRPADDQSQTPEGSQSTSSSDPEVAVNTDQPEPTTPPPTTPSSNTPTKRPPKRSGRLTEGGHPLNRVPIKHRTMASLMDEPDDLPPAMKVPKARRDLNEGPPPLTDDYVGPSDPPPVTSNELGDGLKEARDAITAQGAGLMDEATYEKFRQLGELVTFSRGKPDDTRLSDRKKAVKKVLETLGRTADQPEEIGRLADAFIKDGPGNQEGILLCGTSGTHGVKNGLHAAVIYLAGQESKIFVMSAKKLPFAKDARVVLLGTIMMDPAIDLTGLKEPLEWDRGTAVWLGSVAQLD